MIVPFLKTFLVTFLALLGLVGFVRGMIAGSIALIQSISSRDVKKLRKAVILFVISFLFLLLTILLWPYVQE